jgi:ATP-dependent Clp protease protease subunit
MSDIGPIGASASWPPEVPPFRPPTPPTPPEPPPTLPTWEEYDVSPRERDLDERLLERRIITVTGHLNEEQTNRIASKLLVLDQSAVPVSLHLACAAADLGAGLSLADAIDMVRAPVHASVRGTLPGPALAVLAACARRAAHRHALFLLSLPRTAAVGTASEVGSQSARHRHQVDQLSERIASVTGKTPAEVTKDLEAGRLLSAGEAVGYGLVQDVI